VRWNSSGSYNLGQLGAKKEIPGKVPQRTDIYLRENLEPKRQWVYDPSRDSVGIAVQK